ncbi:MAG: ATP synthase F1 subunit epsilon [Halobacteriovoraceae bacterium]|nr:ATP synthase F1 subunit epsilon [Halobacteriovoraceae bacterium]
MNCFTVDILTPGRILARNLPAESVIVPTLKGQINLLEGHTHVITGLSTGLLSVFGGPDDPDHHFSITTGVGKVLGDKITILADVGEEADEIDEERAQRALENAQDILKNKSLSSWEFTKYERKLARARLRLQLVKMKNN